MMANGDPEGRIFYHIFTLIMDSFSCWSLNTAFLYEKIQSIQCRSSIVNIRVPTSSGNHGKPGKSQKKVPCMGKSWNLKKPEKSWNFGK